jgi:sialate O-acetylesterase
MKSEKHIIHATISKTYVLCCLFMALFCLRSTADENAIHKLSLPAIYSDNMVVPEGEPFILKGHASPFTTVQAEIPGQKKSTLSDKWGNWVIVFDPVSDGQAFIISIYDVSLDTISIHNVVAGDIWLCSGQSNMQMATARTDVMQKMEGADLHFIRYFKMAGEPSAIATDEIQGQWMVVNAANMGQCSAVALSFGWHLSMGLRRQVGLVVNAVGGTPVESWTPLSIVKARRFNDHIFSDREQWRRDSNLYRAKYNDALDVWKKAVDAAKENGTAVPPKIFPPFQLRDNWNPGSLFNSLVHPLRDISFKGVVWYQGESNSGYPFVYRYQLIDLIKSWRKLLNKPSLPFYIVQLPEYGTTDKWEVLRESQAVAADSAKADLVVSLGLGDSGTIHPTRKMALGYRIAAQALSRLYHTANAHSNILPVSVSRSGNQLTIIFQDAGGGLKSIEGAMIRNLEIADESLHFLPARSRIDGGSLIVYNAQIDNPVWVRYAWKSLPEHINLFNSEGFPVAPFYIGLNGKHQDPTKTEEVAGSASIQPATDKRQVAPGFDARWLERKEIEKYLSGARLLNDTDQPYQVERYPPDIVETVSKSPTWLIRAHSSSGVAIRFKTDANRIFLSGSVALQSPQTRPFHLMCNGKVMAGITDFMDSTGKFSWEVNLPAVADMKDIDIVFPAYSKGSLTSIALPRSARLEPGGSKGIMLAYGNSITQMGGEYNGFLSIAASLLDYTLYDAGIGGHIFQSSYLSQKLVENPAFIVVEYGTNDWSGGRDVAEAKPFLARLCSLYPDVPVFLIPPLFRFRPANTDDTPAYENKKGQTLQQYREQLVAIAINFPQVIILDHRALLAASPVYYSDGVHPNEMGQQILGGNLAALIKSERNETP